MLLFPALCVKHAVLALDEVLDVAPCRKGLLRTLPSMCVLAVALTVALAAPPVFAFLDIGIGPPSKAILGNTTFSTALHRDVRLNLLASTIKRIFKVSPPTPLCKMAPRMLSGISPLLCYISSRLPRAPLRACPAWCDTTRLRIGHQPDLVVPTESSPSH